MHPFRAIARWWPAVRAAAVDIGTARVAFFGHVAADPAWADLTYQQIINVVDGLT